MPYMYLKDDAGDVIRVLEINGYYFPAIDKRIPNHEEVVQSTSTWKARNDDVMICAYPKSVGFGSWFDYTLDWENVFQDHPGYPIHVVRYEDMKEDSIKETRRLARFLDVKADEELIQSISNACDFDSMKQEKELIEMAMANIWKDQKPGMYRKGQVWDWKNWFTVAQNELFDAVYAEKMKNPQGSLNISYDIRLE